MPQPNSLQMQRTATRNKSSSSAPGVKSERAPREDAFDAKDVSPAFQGIRRTFALLRVVASAGGRGMRLTEIATRSQLHVATAHRLLRGLVLERAVVYDPFSLEYHIGHDFLEHEDDTLDQRVKAHFHSVVDRLADLTEDSVFLGTRHGLDALYIDNKLGRFPSKSPINVGGRRPLGIGAGSLVLLAALPAREIGRVIDANEQRYPRYAGATERKVRAMLRAYRRDGYAFDGDSVLKGLSVIGVPLYDNQGKVIAAVSIMTNSERLLPNRQLQIVRWMRTEAARVGEFEYIPAHLSYAG